jgi:hypothetical protein
MSFWVVLKNIGIIVDFFKLAAKVLPQAVREKKLPDCAESVQLIESVRKILDSGVIDVPGVDEHAISESLKQIEDRLTCKAS